MMKRLVPEKFQKNSAGNFPEKFSPGKIRQTFHNNSRIQRSPSSHVSRSTLAKPFFPQLMLIKHFQNLRRSEKLSGRFAGRNPGSLYRFSPNSICFRVPEKSARIKSAIRALIGKRRSFWEVDQSPSLSPSQGITTSETPGGGARTSARVFGAISVPLRSSSTSPSFSTRKNRNAPRGRKIQSSREIDRKRVQSPRDFFRNLGSGIPNIFTKEKNLTPSCRNAPRPPVAGGMVAQEGESAALRKGYQKSKKDFPDIGRPGSLVLPLGHQVLVRLERRLRPVTGRDDDLLALDVRHIAGRKDTRAHLSCH